ALAFLAATVVTVIGHRPARTAAGARAMSEVYAYAYSARGRAAAGRMGRWSRSVFRTLSV
ncbi:MAG: hypothetical protein J2P17_32165, partial [Mycobacterium sp.]|nr:hypothetical protein [Mycobacterium sp.]